MSDEWPNIVLEDLLDADVVFDPARELTFPTPSLSISGSLYIDIGGELIYLGNSELKPDAD